MKKKAITLLLLTTLMLNIFPFTAQAYVKGSKVTWFGNASDYKNLLMEPSASKAVRPDKKWGTIDRYGDWVIPAIYTKLDSLSGGLWKATLDKKVGVINLKGEIVIPIKYDKITGPSINDKIFRVELGGKHGFYRSDGTMIADTIYDYAYDFNSGAAIVTNGTTKKSGAIDVNGKLIHDFVYKKMGRNTRYQFWNGIILAENSKGFTGVLDNKGNIVAPFKFNNGWSLDLGQGFGASFSEAEYSVIPDVKRIVISQDTAPLYVDGRKQPGFSGVIDFKGKEILPPQYDMVMYRQAEKSFEVHYSPRSSKKDKHMSINFFIDLNGKVLTPATGYTEYQEMYNGIRVASKGKLQGGLDAKNKEVVPFIFEKIHPFNTSGTAWAKKGGRWGLINKTGKTVVNFQFSEVKPDAPETYTEVALNRADLSRLKGSPRAEGDDKVYQENNTYSASGQSWSSHTGAWMLVRGTPLTGIARVAKDGKFGYISPTGKVITPCIYTTSTAYDGGRAIATKRKGTVYTHYVIDQNGKELNPKSQITYLGHMNWGERLIKPGAITLVEMGDKWHHNYIDNNGKLLLSEKGYYPDADPFIGGIARVYTGTGKNDFGYVDKKGRWIIPSGSITYDKDFKDNFVFVEENGKIGYMWIADLDGPPPYKETFEFVSPTKNQYKTGDEFSNTGFDVKLLDKQDKWVNISKDISFKNGAVELPNGYVWKNPGNKIISAYYNGKVIKTFNVSVESTAVLADGNYIMKGGGVSFYLTSTNHSLALNNTKTAEKFTIKTTNGLSTIKSSKNGYLNWSKKDGYGVYTGKTPQKWIIRRINGDNYVIRSAEKEESMMSFIKTLSANGTGIFVEKITAAIPLRNQIQLILKK